MDLESGFWLAGRSVLPVEGSVAGPAGLQRIEPKAMAVLLELARHAPQTRSRAQIEQTAWPRGHVSEDALTRCIGQLRRALGDDARAPELLETVPRRGYRLRATPQALVDPRAPAASGASAGAAGPPAAWTGTPPGAADAGSAFVGRRSELAELVHLCGPGRQRLVTLTGPGGMGKSRLARQALRRLAAQFPQGVAWVDLQDLSRTGSVLQGLARALKLPLDDERDTLAQLGSHLARGRALAVLDNAEDLEGLPTLVGQLLDAAPGLALLVTSRRSLGLGAERVLGLAGLALPARDGEDPASADASDGLRLFVARAQAARPGFDPARHRQALAAIVRATGGMPLAIELAAAWVRLLPPEAIASELGESPELLARDETAPGSPARPEHRSLRAVLDRSWQLLSAREREVMNALAVFRGGLTASAAREVARASLRSLCALADKGMLTVDATGRFGLHPLILAEARARLLAGPPGAAAELQAGHAQHYARHLGRLAAQASADHGPVVAGLEADFANAQAAWNHAVATGSPACLDEALDAWRIYFEVRGRSSEGIAHFQSALPACGRDDGLRACLHASQVGLHVRKGDFASGAAIARAGIVAAERSGARRALVACLAGAGTCATEQGQWRQARPLFERALEIGRADGVMVEVAAALGKLGILAKKQGQYDDALAHYAQALAIEREQRHHAAVVRLLNNMGGLHMERNAWAPARELMAQGVQLCASHDLQAQRPYLEFGLGATQLELGKLDQAQLHLEQALERSRASEVAVIALYAEANLARVAARRGELGLALQRLGRVAVQARERGWPGLLLHVALFLGEALQGVGRRVEAARLWSLVLADERAEAGTRDSAVRWLGALALDPRERAEAGRPMPALDEVVAAILASGASTTAPR